MSEAAYASAAGRQRRQAVVVLPAFNEGENIGPLLSKIDGVMNDVLQPYCAVVVDDGSRDDTYEVVQRMSGRMPLVVTRHLVNQGLAQTIRDGLAVAVEQAADDDIIITMDADDTHAPGLIPRMLAAVREGHDVVIASRYRPGARVFGVSGARRVFSFAASLLFRLLFPIKGVRDYTCGYRAYHAKILKRAWREYGQHFIDEDGFQCMADILLKLRRLDAIMTEVPLILRYDQKRGASKMHVGSTIRKTLMLLIRRRLAFWNHPS